MTSLIKRIFYILVILAVVLFAGRVFVTQRSAPLELWHTFVPQEMSVQQIDTADWAQYLKHEAEVMESVRTQVTQKLDARTQTAGNRYFEGSPMHYGHLAHDWNRSFVLQPKTKAIGAVVLLHGLTDSPYSIQRIAQEYTAHGFVAVGIRLPGHGTVPAGLVKAQWEDWMAATRLAVREAQTHIDATMPLHVVGYSNGGALAMKYALESIENKQLRKPARVVLMSPMIGVTRFARFAGLAGIPAFFPAFAQAAWLGVVPEFNPFKYNSFPVNGARQSYRLSESLQEQLVRVAGKDGLAELPPVLTFQSVVDFTVSTSAIVTALYQNLPANGSELVLFDVNRSAKFGPLLSPSFYTALDGILPTGPQDYRLTVVANAATGNNTIVERSTAPGEGTAAVRPLDQTYPPGIFSLSHIAIPFAMDDPLYGVTPDPKTQDNYGVNLGTQAPRGERGGIILSMDGLLRVTANPFFPYMLKKMEDTMVAASAASVANIPAKKYTPASTPAPMNVPQELLDAAP